MGAGFYQQGGTVVLNGSVISHNTITTTGPASAAPTYAYGAGLCTDSAVFRGWSNTILDNTAASNYSARGGGVYSTGTSVLLESSTVSGNTAVAQYEARGGGLYASVTTAVLRRSVESPLSPSPFPSLVVACPESTPTLCDVEGSELLASVGLPG